MSKRTGKFKPGAGTTHSGRGASSDGRRPIPTGDFWRIEAEKRGSNSSVSSNTIGLFTKMFPGFLRPFEVRTKTGVRQVIPLQELRDRNVKELHSELLDFVAEELSSVLEKRKDDLSENLRGHLGTIRTIFLIEQLRRASHELASLSPERLDLLVVETSHALKRAGVPEAIGPVLGGYMQKLVSESIRRHPGDY